MSESSLKRWADRGLVPMVKTGGGHRRVLVAGLVGFAREHGHAISRPELLGLPPGAARGTPDPARGVDELVSHLLAGDEAAIRGLLLGAYLAGASAASIVESALGPAFAQIGSGWAARTIGIHEEHRASAIVLGVLHELRELLPALPAEAPTAIGACLSGDHYTLPVTAVQLVLRECGVAATQLGGDLPGEALATALERWRPSMCFVSISVVPDRARLRDAVAEVWRAAERNGIMVLLGGAALDGGLLSELRYSAAPTSMQRLSDLVRPLVARR